MYGWTFIIWRKSNQILHQSNVASVVRTSSIFRQNEQASDDHHYANANRQMRESRKEGVTPSKQKLYTQRASYIYNDHVDNTRGKQNKKRIFPPLFSIYLGRVFS